MAAPATTEAPSARPSESAAAVAASLPPMPGRRDGDCTWPDRFFVEPSFEAVLASWRARAYPVKFNGRPRAWAVQAVKGDGVYEAWAERWERWLYALDRLPEDPGGALGRLDYEASRPTAARIWLVGHEVW